VGRILKASGWSWQKPVHRATQRDEAAIRRWKEERWPALSCRSGSPRTGGQSVGTFGWLRTGPELVEEPARPGLNFGLVLENGKS
jgi:hypothetical protein